MYLDPYCANIQQIFYHIYLELISIRPYISTISIPCYETKTLNRPIKNNSQLIMEATLYEPPSLM